MKILLKAILAGTMGSSAALAQNYGAPHFGSSTLGAPLAVTSGGLGNSAGTADGLTVLGRTLANTLGAGGVTASMLASGAAATSLGYTPLSPANNLSDLASAATARTNLGLGPLQSGYSSAAGLGSAANASIGSSGATVPLLNTANTFSALQTLSSGETVSGPASMVNLYTSPPTSALYDGAGFQYSICDIVGCIAGDHTRASSYWVDTTVNDATKGEYHFQIDTVANTGFAANWQISTDYFSGAQVVSNGAIYTEAVASCTSLGSGGGPSGTGSGISDGSCSWNYGSPSITNGKVGFANSMVVKANSGHAWGSAEDMVVQQNVYNGMFVATKELDAGLANANQDCAIGVANCYDLYMSGGTLGPITSYIGISASSGGTGSYAYASHFGLLFQGASNFIKDADIADWAAGALGYQSTGNHATAFVEDTGTSPIGLWLNGSYSTAGIVIKSGATSEGVALGATATSGTSVNSQSLLFGYFDSGSNAQNMVWSVTSNNTMNLGGSVAGQNLSIPGKTASGSFSTSATSAIGYTDIGTHSVSSFDTTGATTSVAFKAASGQSVCLDSSDACWTYAGSNTTYFKQGSTPQNVLALNGASTTTPNLLTILNAPTGFGPSLKASGVDANIPLNLYGQGTGAVAFQSVANFDHVDGTASYILAAMLPGTSGYGSFVQYSDNVTYNWGVGGGTGGAFEFWNGRYPGNAGTKVASLSSGGALTVNADVRGGSAPTNSGTCAINTQVGGNTAGSFKASGACAGGTVILTFATPAPNDWVCEAFDATTPADTLKQSNTSASTTSATFTATMASGDLVRFHCTAF
jgi:hypothetical protein